MAKPVKHKKGEKENIEEIVNESLTGKRPRGRPRKEPPDNNVKNENKKSVTMSSEQGYIEQIQAQQVNIQQGQMRQDYNDDYSINGLNDKFKKVFSKYQNLSPNILMGAFNQTMLMLNNPFIQNMRIKQSNAQAMKATKEELQKALENPANSELTLQQISFGLYYNNYFYNKMVKMDRDTPLYNYYSLPEYIDEKDIHTESFKKESIKVDRILKAFKPKLTFKTIATQVIIEGKSCYLPRYSIKEDGTVDFFVLQKLNTDMIKLTAYGSEQMFVASFNMMIFLNSSMYSVEQYPPFIRGIWEKMLSSDMISVDENNKRVVNPKASNLPGNGTLEWKDKTWAYWVQLPQDLCYTFYTDGGHALAIPDAISLFDDFQDLDNYKILQQSLLSRGINSIMTAEVPLISSANLKPGQNQSAISPDVVQGYTDLFSAAVSGNMMFFAAPFQKFDVHSVDSQPESLEIVYDRNRDLLATTGNSALISTDSKPSLASVITARLFQEAKVDYLTKQFEEFLNNMLEKEFGLKFNWRVTLFSGIFKKDDEITATLNAINNGYEGLIPKLLALHGYTLEDYRSAKLYLDALDVKPYKSFEIEKMKLANELNVKAQDNQTQIDIEQSEDESQKKRGRKPLPDDKIDSDTTVESRDSGQDSEMKQANMYSVNTYNNVCAKCGKPLTQDEIFICSECFEQLKEDYGD